MHKRICILECRPVSIYDNLSVLAALPQEKFFAERKRLQYFVEASGNDKIDGPFELLSFIQRYHLGQCGRLSQLSWLNLPH